MDTTTEFSLKKEAALGLASETRKRVRMKVSKWGVCVCRIVHGRRRKEREIKEKGHGLCLVVIFFFFSVKERTTTR